MVFEVCEVCVSRLLGPVGFTTHYGPNWDLWKTSLAMLFLQYHSLPSANSLSHELYTLSLQSRKDQTHLERNRLEPCFPSVKADVRPQSAGTAEDPPAYAQSHHH